MNEQQFEEALKNGSYAWPGGYPLYLLMADGGTMHIKCAEKNRENIVDSIKTDTRDGWLPAAVDVNYEDEDMICCQCNEKIESAYGGK